MNYSFRDPWLPQLNQEFADRVGDSPPTLETDFTCGCSDGALLVICEPLDSMLERLSRAVAILAIRKRRRIADAKERGHFPGDQLYYLENWPLDFCWNFNFSAIKVSERGNACWLTDKEVEHMRRKPS